MITCPNPSCQATNPDDQTVCLTCQTAIPHRYLWVVGGGASLKPGKQLANRYTVQPTSPQIVLDTQPGFLTEVPTNLPDFVRPYLFLTSYPVAVPRPYALLPDGTLLLEDAAIVAEPPAKPPTVMAALTDRWAQATPLRQLNWLWQIAQLWQPCSDEQVAGTLLQLPLCRVDGGLLKLLEIRLDVPGQPATPAALGPVWQPLADQAHPTLRPFLQALCEQLQTGAIQAGEQLVEGLEQGIAIALPQQSVTGNLAVLTDQGPTRQRNEDTCYPTSGSTQPMQFVPSQPGQPRLLMVCDGIGGHEGGDVASKLAVAMIEQRLKPLLQPSATYPDPVTVALALEQAICAANDEIAQQNDHEARQARDRMGTTAVIGLILGPQLYLAHIGDSRAYRISARRCQQVTLDDDVAAREVRLGYGFYHNVVDQPGTGALVQALGMNASTSLYPNVQRFLLDEDCVFLLCSDGLSDGERVEQFWESELLPLVRGHKPTLAVAESLVQIANTYNGHDNVTVGLLQVSANDYQPQPIEPDRISARNPARQPTQTTRLQTRQPPARTRLAAKAAPAPAPSRPSIWPLLLGIVGLVALAGGLVTFLFADSGLRTVSTGVSTDDAPIPDSTVRPSPPDSPPQENRPLTLEPLTYAALAEPLSLQASPELADGTIPATTSLPSGTIIRVLSKQDLADQSRWVQVEVCGQAKETPSPSNPDDISPEQVLPPAQGWILESQLAARVQTASDLPESCLN